MFAVAACALAVITTARGADPPIEGDAELLRVLQAAQATNATLFSRGHLTVHAVERISTREVLADVIWSGDRTYWSYTLTDEHEVEHPRGPQLRDSSYHIEFIEIPGQKLWYSAKRGRAGIDLMHTPGRGYLTLLELRPDQAWFRMDGQYGGRPVQRSTWASLLDPASAPDTVEKFVVRAAGDDRVIVERHHSIGPPLHITASLAHGGNIVAYETVFSDELQREPPVDVDFWRKGRYEWADAGDGSWYVKHFEFQRSGSDGDRDHLAWDFSMDVQAFDPDPDIPTNQFTFAAFHVPPGTVVEEKRGSRERTYRIGTDGREQGLLGPGKLNDLADQLRSRGFASPERTSK